MFLMKYELEGEEESPPLLLSPPLFHPNLCFNSIHLGGKGRGKKGERKRKKDQLSLLLTADLIGKSKGRIFPHLVLSSSTKRTTALALGLSSSWSTILSKSPLSAFLRIFVLTATQMPARLARDTKEAMPFSPYSPSAATVLT